MPTNAQNLLPKICTKSPISLWSYSVVHGLWVNEIWARRGDSVAYRLVVLLVSSDGQYYQLRTVQDMARISFADLVPVAHINF